METVIIVDETANDKAANVLRLTFITFVALFSLVLRKSINEICESGGDFVKSSERLSSKPSSVDNGNDLFSDTLSSLHRKKKENNYL